jgi:inosine/xanthosine triphosphate pyrophosphatase family protein
LENVDIKALVMTHLPARGYQETFAEIDSALKNTISHRAIASRQLIRFFKNEK